jgi:hypothetical protein
VTDSKVVRPFAERLEGARFARPARALDCLRAELPLRVADPPLDERPVERLLVARVVERDLEESDDAPRRGDVLVWAMLSSLLLGIRSRIPYPGGIGVIPVTYAVEEVFA